MTDIMIDKLAFIVLKDKKIAMVRSHNKSLFYIPGGKREQGETDNQALIREVKEELSVDINADSIVFYDEFTGQADGKPQGTFVRIRCFSGEYNGELVPASEIAQLAWLDSNDLTQCSAVAVLILNSLKQRGLIN